MNKRALLFPAAILAAAALLMAVYAFGSTVSSKRTMSGKIVTPAAELQQDNVAAPPEEDGIKKLIAAMPMEEKVGQLVMAGVIGDGNSSTWGRLIEEYHVGGFVVFKQNAANTGDMLTLLNNLKSRNKKNRAPLFLSVDEEGGRVSRMPAEFVKIPSARRIGKIDKDDFSFGIGCVIAEEIKAFGFNMNYAPVLDVDSNPRNPVIGERSFGTTADVVSRLGVSTMKGLQKGKIIPVVKHFPGHGDTHTDSHVSLPAVDADIARLKGMELIPFARAIENNADAVMVAHILMTKIDPVKPASLSKEVITGLLRQDMGFDGVVITDDLTMGAIIKNYDIGKAAVESINAGSDIVMVCHDFEKELAVVNALREAAKDGTISEDRINESVYRILTLKEKYEIRDSLVESIDVDKINKSIREVLDKFMKN